MPKGCDKTDRERTEIRGRERERKRDRAKESGELRHTPRQIMLLISATMAKAATWRVEKRRKKDVRMEWGEAGSGVKR